MRKMNNNEILSEILGEILKFAQGIKFYAILRRVSCLHSSIYLYLTQCSKNEICTVGNINLSEQLLHEAVQQCGGVDFDKLCRQHLQ